MDSVYTLLIKEPGYDPCIFPDSFSTEKDARSLALKLLKDSYQCNVIESYDYDEIHDLDDFDFIVEDEHAYYEGDEIVFQYIIQKVNLPKNK